MLLIEAPRLIFTRRECGLLRHSRKRISPTNMESQLSATIQNIKQGVYYAECKAENTYTYALRIGIESMLLVRYRRSKLNSFPDSPKGLLKPLFIPRNVIQAWTILESPLNFITSIHKWRLKASGIVFFDWMTTYNEVSAIRSILQFLIYLLKILSIEFTYFILHYSLPTFTSTNSLYV